MSTSGHGHGDDGREGEGEGEGRCELCEGPHDLDACPVFAGNTLGGPENEGKKGFAAGGGKFCADCEVSFGLSKRMIRVSDLLCCGEVFCIREEPR